jgi:type IV secretion system protein VirB6
LILTTLILTAPPMAAMFFQGTLGSFMAYSQIAGSAAAGPQGQPPGSYTPQQTTNANTVPADTHVQDHGTRVIGGGGAGGGGGGQTAASGQLGNAPTR